MQVKFYCPHWGSENLSYSEFLTKVKKAGYDGVEMMMPEDAKGQKEIEYCLKDLNLELIGHVGGPLAGKSVQESLKNFEILVRRACINNPLFINLQTGRDYYTFEQNKQFFTQAQYIANEKNISIIHETHRSKFSFAAHITEQYLQRYPELRLTADFSHWCCVAETLLEDQHKAVELAIKHTDHIHARVGFSQAPQVPDPRAVEWQAALNAHLVWWDKIVQTKRDESATSLTITPECGPAPYMTLLPHSTTPIANQWDINLFMKDLLSERYNPKNRS